MEKSVPVFFGYKGDFGIHCNSKDMHKCSDARADKSSKSRSEAH